MFNCSELLYEYLKFECKSYFQDFHPKQQNISSYDFFQTFHKIKDISIYQYLNTRRNFTKILNLQRQKYIVLKKGYFSIRICLCRENCCMYEKHYHFSTFEKHFCKIKLPFDFSNLYNERIIYVHYVNCTIYILYNIIVQNIFLKYYKSCTKIFLSKRISSTSTYNRHILMYQWTFFNHLADTNLYIRLRNVSFPSKYT